MVTLMALFFCTSQEDVMIIFALLSLTQATGSDSEISSVEDSSPKMTRQQYYGIADYLPEEIRVDGLAKLRIWVTHGKMSNVGHVSLETSNSYCSLWPSERRKAALLDGVPAFQALGYGYDRLHDRGERRSPDHVYLLRLNTKKIDKMMRENYSGDRPLKWYANGHPDNQTDKRGSRGDICRFNCASFTLNAMREGLSDDPDELRGFQHVVDQMWRDKGEPFLTRGWVFYPSDFLAIMRRTTVPDIGKILRWKNLQIMPGESEQKRQIVEYLGREYLTGRETKQEQFWKRVCKVPLKQGSKKLRLVLKDKICQQLSSGNPQNDEYEKKLELTR